MSRSVICGMGSSVLSSKVKTDGGGGTGEGVGSAVGAGVNDAVGAGVLRTRFLSGKTIARNSMQSKQTLPSPRTAAVRISILLLFRFSNSVMMVFTGSILSVVS